MKLLLLVLVHSVFLVREGSSELHYTNYCSDEEGVAVGDDNTIEVAENFGVGCYIEVFDYSMTPRKLKASLVEKVKDIGLVAKSILGSVQSGFQSVSRNPITLPSEFVVFERIEDYKQLKTLNYEVVPPSFKILLEPDTDDVDNKCDEKIVYKDEAVESTDFTLPDNKKIDSSCMKYIVPEDTAESETTTVTVTIENKTERPKNQKCKHGFVAYSTDSFSLPEARLMGATIKCAGDLKKEKTTFTVTTLGTAQLFIYRKKNQVSGLSATYTVTV